ncbi:MAG: hypothetical protein KAI53_00910 [Candidatus Aenigmarchaeota archaeon]|nr:hypothetical protein [Candidatus Aenigmarchaeota archaeon]
MIVLEDYFKKAKSDLEKKIPDYGTDEFGKFRDKIRVQLKKKESDHFLIVRGLKVLVLGDWNTKEKKQRLYDLKTILLGNGIYAETIDKYCDVDKKGGLSQLQILELCCIQHQLIVFIDGTGTGTLVEQNYLATNYVFHGKILYFIEESKFDESKHNPSVYFKDFPTIVPYGTDKELFDKVLIYSNLRIYRLAEIVQKQVSSGKGLSNPKYKPWKDRLSKIPRG